MKEVDFIRKNKKEFLKFLKSKFTMIHMSNFFFRDFHYGTMSYLREHGMNKKYGKAELVALELLNILEKEGTFKKIDNLSWMVNYPEFTLPRAEKKTS